jgi:hypothetical protein
MPLIRRKLRGRRALLILILVAATCAISSPTFAHRSNTPGKNAASALLDANTDVEGIQAAIFRYTHSINLADTTLASQIWFNSSDAWRPGARPMFGDASPSTVKNVLRSFADTH